MLDEVTVVRSSLDIIQTTPATSIENILRETCGIHRRTQETVWVATFNAAGNLHTVSLVAQGGFDETHLHIPAVMNVVALSGADRFLIAHNHPNGWALPSPTDLALTAVVAKAADAIGYTLEDHLIFDSKGTCVSLTRTGVMTPRQTPVLRRLEKR